MHSFDISQQLLDFIPDNFFYKDIKSHFMRCNSNFAKLAGYRDPNALIGKGDEDCPWDSYSEVYHEADKRVLSGETIILLEPIISKSRNKLLLRTTKQPLYENDIIIGLMAHCQFIGDKQHSSRAVYDLMSDNLLNINKLELKKHFNGLTKRESEVLFFIIRCFTMKDIGLRLGISKRTVEYYTENIKLKFACHNINELICKAMLMGFQHLLPESLIPII